MSVGTKVVGGAIVTALAVALLTSVDWQALNVDKPRSNPVNPRPDQRLYIEATISSENPARFHVAWNGAGVGPPAPEWADPDHGWIPTGIGNTRKQTFGPYKRGDLFTVRVFVDEGTYGNTYVRCALKTQGQIQLQSPPHMVVGKDGQATCSHRAGD